MQCIKPAQPQLQNGHPLASGLLFANSLASPSWTDSKTGAFPAATSGMTIAGSPLGNGAGVAGGAQFAGFSYSSQPPRIWAMRALFYLTSITGGFICGWNGASNGANGITDRQLYIDTSNRICLYVFDGSQKVVIGPTVLAGMMYDVFAYCNNSQAVVIVNGRAAATVSLSNGGFQGYTLPVFFVLGRSSPSSGGASLFPGSVAFNGTLLSAEFWNVSADFSGTLAVDPFVLYRSRLPRNTARLSA